MRRELDSWFSPTLNKNMEIATYGHYGFALLLIPTAAADYLEYERFLLLDVLQPHIDAGKVKVFSVNSINSESWLNNSMQPNHKAIRHNDFNHYIIHEVVPYIRHKTSHDTPIITSGASLGALHAANLYLKYPYHLDGTIAMSGVYDLTTYTKGYWDEDVYFNSPVHYMQNLNDPYYLNRLRQSNHLHILAGSGDYEDPGASRYLSSLLSQKGIPHDLDIWGHDMKHDWPTWRAMLPYVVGQKF
jgi:esterase/lipase superfamily enzyme